MPKTEIFSYCIIKQIKSNTICTKYIGRWLHSIEHYDTSTCTQISVPFLIWWGKGNKVYNIMHIFFLGYAGEPHIFVLKKKKRSLQTIHVATPYKPTRKPLVRTDNSQSSYVLEKFTWVLNNLIWPRWPESKDVLRSRHIPLPPQLAKLIYCGELQCYQENLFIMERPSILFHV